MIAIGIIYAKEHWDRGIQFSYSYSRFPVTTQANSRDPEPGMVECDVQCDIGIPGAIGRSFGGDRRTELVIKPCPYPAPRRAKVPEDTPLSGSVDVKIAHFG
jgi:hypothetical protein